MSHTPERILTAAINAMIHGRHKPHCYRAHRVGSGYVNNGLAQGEVLPERIAANRADYLRQLEQSATSELENMGYALSYAEPGYTQPVHGVLLANWNCFPSTIDRTLERAGYAVEWSDEWGTCDDCNRAVRTSADSFCWRPYSQYIEYSRDYADPYHSDSVELCLDCLQEWAEGCRANELQDLADQVQDAINAHANDYMYRDCEACE